MLQSERRDRLREDAKELLQWHMRRVLFPLLLCASLGSAHAQQTLPVTPKTIAWGYYWSQAKPVLTVHSGDTVRVNTLSTCGPPERLKAGGVRAEDIPQSATDIYAMKDPDKGPGGHILTGPIAIAEAVPGDV